MEETSRQHEGQSDLPTSTMASQAEMASKRRRRQTHEEQLWKEPQSAAGPSRRRRNVDKGGESVPYDLLDTEDQPVTQAGSSTCSDEEAVTQESPSFAYFLEQLSRIRVILGKVISFLDSSEKIFVAQVSSVWREEVYKPWQWRDTEYCVNANHVDEKLLPYLEISEIKQLRVVGGDRDKIATLLQLPRLESLCLSTKEGTAAFLETMPKMNSSSLKRLELAVRNKEQVDHFQKILTKMPNLLSLSIGRLISNKLIEAISKDLKELKELSLTGSTISIKELKGLSELHTLTLESSSVTDFSDICGLKKGLNKLKMRDCNLFCENWLAEVSKLSSLTELGLQRCKPNADGRLEPQILNKMNLKKLTFFPALDRDVRLIASVHTLEEIALSCMVQVSDKTLRLISENITNLKSFSLSGKASQVQDLEPLGHVSSLQKLSVKNGSWIRRFLQTVTQSHCNLTRLEVKQFREANERDIENISKISTLRELVLGLVPEGSRMLVPLQSGAFKLEVLELRSCGVTFANLKPLFEKQIYLRTLVIVGPEVEKEIVPSPWTLLPNLKKCQVWKLQES